MASSGWQGEQFIVQRSSSVSYYGNLYISSITHSGTNLTVSGTIRFTAKGTSGASSYYNYGVQADPAGSQGFLTILGNNVSIANGTNKDVTFTTTVSNVSASATSYSFGVRYVAWYNQGHTNTYWDVTKSWTLTFSASGSAPEGLYVTYNDSTWNSVSFTSGASSWGGLNAQNHVAMFVGSTNGDAASYTDNTFGTRPRYEWYHDGTQDLAWTYTGTQANANGTLNTPIGIKGLTHYKLGIWGANGVWSGGIVNQTLRYLPPAPSQFTYTDPGGAGAKTYPVTFSGVAANNHTTYDSASLTRTVRYKIDNGNWVYVDNATVAAIDLVTSFNIMIPAGSTATVEGWQTYHGMQSEVATISIANTNQAGKLYGSVNSQAKEIIKLYGPVNGQTKKIVKLYASVGGVAKKVYEDV